MLIAEEVDDNVHPVNTLRFVDALIKANKSFGLLIMTDFAHGMKEPYVIRRRWDYFVEHLRGERPAMEYTIRRPVG